jgi:AraC family transcriptional regulator
MHEDSEFKLKSAHGVQLLRRDVRSWNGITVSVIDISCSPGRAWHDISPPQDRMAIVLEQIAGRVESRTKKDQPSQSNWLGPQYIDYAPAGMPVWGYTNNVRSVRGADFAFDFPSLESTLGERIDLQQTGTPHLQFFDERIIRIGSLLAAECMRPRDLSDLYGDSLVAALVIDFLRFGRDRTEEKKQGTLAPWQLHRAKECMEANLVTGVRLRDLAEITRLSQSQFGRAFKASTGLPPHRWQMNLRITRAQQLLLDGELSLAQIAFATGFSEQSHLTRVFRSIVGVSPGSWRRDRRS